MARPRSSIRGSQKTVNKAGYRPVLIVLGIVLILRLIHLAFALRSPLSFQLSPDEDYYMRFALSVAQGNGASTAQFAFMDPAYGYIAGLVFRIFSGSLFALYMLQILLDTFHCVLPYPHRPGTAASPRGPAGGPGLRFHRNRPALLHSPAKNHLGCELHDRLGSMRAYAFAQAQNVRLAAVRNCCADTESRCVLRCCPWRVWPCCFPGSARFKHRARHGKIVRGTGMLILGLVLPITLLSLHNARAIGSFSPLPTNGGIVLHQRYNPDNRTGANWIPAFVSYWHPIDIYRGYTEEARKRLGRELSPREVDAYWRGQAMDYIISHPSQVASNIVRKFALFVAFPEIPNDRSLADERLFSPILSILPSPFGWLFALGVPGFVLLLRNDRRGWILMIPVATVIATVTLFDSIDRYRFQAVPIFALGAGLFLEYLTEYLTQQKTRQAVILLTAFAVLGTVSVSLAGISPVEPPRWDKAVWGYLKMGNQKAAKALAMRVAEEQPENYRIQNALGQIASSEGDYAGAANYYRRAVELRPNSHVDHYRLALMFAKIGLHDEAVEQAAIAVRIAPQPEYQALLRELRAGR